MNRTIPDNYVRMEKKVCSVCGTVHEHNTGILLHKNLIGIPEDKCVTGYGLCKEHDDLFKDDYIALIGVSNTGKDTSLKMENADRTGAVAHLKRHVFKDMFNTNIPDTQEMVFVDNEVIGMLERMSKDAA